MNKNEFFVSNWLALVETIHKQSPEYGKISIDLFFHQGNLSKAIIIERFETIVFEKTEKRMDNE